MSLDLTEGDEQRAERIAQEGSERSRRVRSDRKRSGSGSSGSRSSSSGSSKGGTAKSETDLVSRLVTAFNKLAEQRDARNDQELADAIREDAEAMSRGLVSLTRTLTFLRFPLLFLLSFLEPVLAFWHVGGILVGRFIQRRQRVMAEREMAMAEAAQADNGAGAVA